MSGHRACRVLVSGRVQGVGFRYAARDAATRIGVTGWVRNLPDGRVEAQVEGDPVAVEEMLRWLRRGPDSSSVADAQTREAEPGGATEFVVRPTGDGQA